MFGAGATPDLACDDKGTEIAFGLNVARGDAGVCHEGEQFGSTPKEPVGEAILGNIVDGGCMAEARDVFPNTPGCPRRQRLVLPPSVIASTQVGTGTLY